MTKNQQSSRSHKQLDPQGYAAGITSLARVERSLRSVKEASARFSNPATAGDAISRRGAVYGPLTAEQTEFDADLQAEIARQDADPAAYALPPFTPKEMSETFNVPVEMCWGLGTEA